MNSMIKDTRGFSTSFDALIFLVLVSLSAAVMAPSLVGNTQIEALHSVNAAEHNSQVLLSLVNGRVDNFGYSVGGTQMDLLVTETLGPDAVNSGIYKAGKKLIAGRELKHKTVADLASESVASQFNVYRRSRTIRLNLLTREYSNNIDAQIKTYLDDQIGNRYRYNVTVIWRPIRDIPIGGETFIGPPVPDTAYVESTWITMPYHTEFTRYHVETLIDSELKAIGIDLEKASKVPRRETEKMIAGHINEAIGRAVDAAMEQVVDMTLGKTLDKTQTSLNQQIDNVIPGNNSGINDVIKQEIFSQLESDFKINASLDLTDQVTVYLQTVARELVYEITKDEVDELASDITGQYITRTADLNEVKAQVLDYVFSRINISRARMTLAIWDKNN